MQPSFQMIVGSEEYYKKVHASMNCHQNDTILYNDLFQLELSNLVFGQSFTDSGVFSHFKIHNAL